MTHITVTPVDIRDEPWRFRVVVEDDRSASSHDVTLSPEDFARLGSTHPSAEDFVRACFRFLLEREPKESILPAFDVRVIGRYFPGFETAIASSG